MKLIVLILMLTSFGSFAATSANCELVNGIYQNSSATLQDLRFETIVDIFTLNNANALNFTLDGEDLRFIRSEMKVTKQTRMIYLLKKKDKAVRAIHLMIDRTPKEVNKHKEFYGNMIISEEIPENKDFTSVIHSKNLVYNFYCRF